MMLLNSLATKQLGHRAINAWLLCVLASASLLFPGVVLAAAQPQGVVPKPPPLYQARPDVIPNVQGNVNSTNEAITPADAASEEATGGEGLAPGNSEKADNKAEQAAFGGGSAGKTSQWLLWVVVVIVAVLCAAVLWYRIRKPRKGNIA